MIKDQLHERALVQVDLPCIRCARNLRGQPGHGQCPECGMDIAKSLHLAALRSEDPASLERTIKGMDVQSWGTLLGLMACVIGPLVLRSGISFEVFAFVVTGLMGVIGLWLLQRKDAEKRDLSGFFRGLLPVATGGLAIAIPALAMRSAAFGTIHLTLISFFVGGAVLWFISECAKLRLLEEVASQLPGRDLVGRARSVRWGTYAAVLALAIGLLIALKKNGVSGIALPRVSSALILTTSVAWITITLLTVLLYDRASRQMRQQAAFARVVRKSAGFADLRQLPNEPQWIIPAQSLFGT